MKRTILFPTDFSENANKSLDYAIGLAEKMDARIIVFHAYTILTLNTDLPYTVLEKELEETQKKAIGKLTETVKLIKQKNPEIPCTYFLDQGFPATLISEVAKKEKADFIVMGTKGAGPVKAFFFGSNASDVIEKAPCPVLAIPDKAVYTGITHIVYATDYNDSDIADLQKIALIAKLYNSEITLINISDEGKEIQEAVTKLFLRDLREKVPYPNINIKLLEGDNVIKEIENYLKTHPADVLVMSTRKRSFLEKVVERSITKRIAYHGEVPLMAFHAKESE